MFYITHLYPTKMSIYGDIGNVLAMQFWLARLGLEYIYQPVEIGESLPDHTDFYFMGGGQDKDQEVVAIDLKTKKDKLKKDVDSGTALLTICGGYQLLGQQFVTGAGIELNGLGIFPVVTKSPDSSVKSRCIGNILIESDILEDGQKLRLVGFENHGGQTRFVNDKKTENIAKPLGKVLVGYGNNYVDKQEGCIYRNAIGTYCHGSFLPKNPEITLWLIRKALEAKGQQIDIPIDILDEQIATKAREVVTGRVL